LKQPRLIVIANQLISLEAISVLCTLEDHSFL